MASVYDLKSRFQSLLRPVVGWLAGRGVTANQVTLAAAGLSLAHGAWIAAAAGSALALLLLPVTLFTRMALNAIDGMLAREHGQQSRLGAVLNEICDMISDAALYLPLALIAGIAPAPIVLGVVAALIGEATGILGPGLGASRRYDGPMGKSDRAVAYGGIAVASAAGFADNSVLHAALWIIAGLAALTIVNRARALLGQGEKR